MVTEGRKLSAFPEQRPRQTRAQPRRQAPVCSSAFRLLTSDHRAVLPHAAVPDDRANYPPILAAEAAAPGRVRRSGRMTIKLL